MPCVPIDSSHQDRGDALQVKDISDDPLLLNMWGQKVPVLLLDTEGSLLPMPRGSPRESADRMAVVLERFIRDSEAEERLEP